MCSRFLCLSQRKRAYAVPFSHFPLLTRGSEESGSAGEHGRELRGWDGEGGVCPFAYVMVEKNVENVYDCSFPERECVAARWMLAGS